MPGMRWVVWLILASVAAAEGCCRFCDRWCGPHTPAATASYPQQCVPCCPVICCPPGTAPANYSPAGQAAPAAPQQGWQRTYHQPVNCCQ